MTLARSVVLVALLLTLMVASQSLARQPQPPYGRPRLLVILVVDQMRADYVEKFQHQWTGGLRRLFDQGAWFQSAAYRYFNTVTCPGHATIATGAHPATHGMVLNYWWDRSSARRVSCTTDPQSPNVSYGAPSRGGNSAIFLKVPTLADEMRSQLERPPRIVTLSLKPRSAIMLAGQRSDATTWFSSNPGVWLTSSAYSTSPVPFVKEFVTRHPIQSDLGRVWTRLLPPAAYRFDDDASEERPTEGENRSFPHPIRGKGNRADHRFYELWRESPFSDAYLARMASAIVDAFDLGRGDRVDFLGVSFSALDVVGHRFGPASHEVQDVLARLDRTIGALLAHLDRRVGVGRYTVALSADHGVSPIPEQAARQGLDAGRIVVTHIVEAVERALTKQLGPGKYVAHLEYTDLYFEPGVYDRLRSNPRAMQAAIDAVQSVPGVQQVLRGEELDKRRALKGVAAAVAVGYDPARSGDLIVVPKPYWLLINPKIESIPPLSATTHGTAYEYDRRVPLVFAGAGIEPGKYQGDTTPADLAPTLARLIGVTLPKADGRVLREALESMTNDK